LPVAGDPVEPADLSAEARVVWRRVMRTQAPGVIRAAHTDALRIYCETVVRYNRAAKLLMQTGELVQGRGGLVRSPLAQIVRDAADQARLYACELGLTPSSVSTLSADAGGRQGGSDGGAPDATADGGEAGGV
jgi:P27 family predicted phage terminase small subunit